MNRFIMADASKCIGCRTCEVACVVSHQAEQDCASLTPDNFLPRIHVIKGVNISTAAICRQCDAGALHRVQNLCGGVSVWRDGGGGSPGGSQQRYRAERARGESRSQ